MIWVYITFVLIQIIGYPIVVFKLITGLIKKDRVKVINSMKWSFVLIIFSGLVFEKIPGSKYFWYPFEVVNSKIFTKKLTGESFNLGDPIEEYHSERAFNGDGYSIDIYELNSQQNMYFESPNPEFYTEYPAEELREDWETNRWEKTPLKKEDMPAFCVAVLYRNKVQIDLNEIVNEDGNYYAYQFFRHNEVIIGNVDFYIISPKRKLFILINLNT